MDDDQRNANTVARHRPVPRALVADVARLPTVRRPVLHCRQLRGPRWFCGPLLVAFTCVGLGLVAGCAQWKPEDGETASAATPGLPPARVPDSAAILDIIFLPIPATSEAGATSETGGGTRLPWDAMDDSVLPAEVRRRLSANGLRAGRVLTLEREQIEQIVDEEDPSARLLRQANVASEFESRRRRLSCREGQPYTIVVRRPSTGTQSTLIRTADGVVGRSLDDPQFTLRLQTHLMDDGRVAVHLVPDIQHGEFKQNYIASDSLAFRVDYSRPSWTLEELAIDVPLSDDQAVVFLAAEEPFGVGEQMFVGQRADQAEERTAVVIQLRRRPVQGMGL